MSRSIINVMGVGMVERHEDCEGKKQKTQRSSLKSAERMMVAKWLPSSFLNLKLIWIFMGH